ncbi:hypothetical protein KIN20_028221 [Parelaphostrongylus tenuis]|uniref:C2H2-type domain-containing protein n=1 Tax=Parelaphostrongylus tenuis TaxID=148309 RepID=A0AAD5WEU2_PARTN|nr:hypothetical protein KIN20_028221 [Parelaphostrongylus tenuis]
MEGETKCGALETVNGTYETEPDLYESNLIEPLFEPGQTLAVKEETDEDSLTVNGETGENWFCYATDLLSASSSSADFSGNNVLYHISPSSDEEKVCEILHATDKNLKDEHENSIVEELNQCVKCGKQFASKNLLRKHLYTHRRGKRNITCEECGRIFSRADGLYTHKQVVHENHRFMCMYGGCDHPGFRSRKSLIEHIRLIHTKVRPYECETCGKAFINRDQLEIHRVKHTSESRFHCTCGVKFRHKSSLIRHRRLCLS